jgi:hypothetical protein
MLNDENIVKNDKYDSPSLTYGCLPYRIRHYLFIFLLIGNKVSYQINKK